MKIQEFSELVQKEQTERYLSEFPVEKCIAGPEAHQGIVQRACSVEIKPGKKYTKVDVGRSGKFMVDEEGNIFGIKGYGKIHRGNYYGTLETTHEWNWGDFYPTKKKVQP